MTNFKDMLFGTASRVAETLGLPTIKTKRTMYGVDGSRGGPNSKGKAYRSYIKYDHKGPFYLQGGWLPTGAPMMLVRHIHRFLHATKGWRVQRTATVTAKLPNAQRRRTYGPRTQGYLDHGKFVFATGTLWNNERIPAQVYDGRYDARYLKQVKRDRAAQAKRAA